MSSKNSDFIRFIIDAANRLPSGDVESRDVESGDASTRCFAVDPGDNPPTAPRSMQSLQAALPRPF
ncbi:hypothetical protein [Stieleria maiorica]|uniref:hypothetical protein n=1 Tax=Stieleria maiorica TaxID=2795974 RepID=UPI0011C70F8B|nr:hypothetical protein [Stieleria maiorica]